VWARFNSNGYPFDPWTRLLTEDVIQGAPFASDDASVEFGQFDENGETKSDWYYMLVGDSWEELNDDYANTNDDHEDLGGRLAVMQSQEIGDSVGASFRGAGGYTGDRWRAQTRYQWGKENVLRQDPKRQWRTEGDEKVVTLDFFEHNNRPWRSDFISLHGINFEKFDIQADDASTFDSDGGSPEFSLTVGWGALDTDDAVGLIVPTSRVELVDEDWVQITPAHGKSTSLYKGRFDKDAISGRRYFLRVLNGLAAGNVYRIESVEMIDDTGGRSWNIRLAPNADGSYPTIASDGLTNSDDVGIFGDAIAIELPAATFYRLTGYRYMRIKIANQTTWDDNFRVGHVMLGMSEPLGPHTVDGQFVPKTADAEWGASLDTEPSVGVAVAPDKSTSKRRQGRAQRVVSLQWTGQSGIDSWQTAVRSMLEAASSDTPVVFMENDSFQHTGPTAPAGTASRVCYDPILCMVEGVIRSGMEAYFPCSPRYGPSDMRGLVSSVSGVVLREIV